MNKDAIDAVRREFLKYFPDFEEFKNPPDKLREGEINYKRDANRKAHELLGDYVTGQQQFTFDAQAQESLLEVIDLTNFLNWRDKAYIIEQLFVEEGDWLKFAQLMLRCLAGADSDAWRDPLQELLTWLEAKGCSANITKILPTYFLFLWDPGRHFSIKSRFVDKFLKLLGERPLGNGNPLTVDGYVRVCQTMQDFRDQISDWQPQDNIDVHSLAWLATGGWAEIPRLTDDKPTPSDPPPQPTPRTEIMTPPRPDIPLNLILAGPPGTGKTFRLLTHYQPQFEERVAEQSLDEFVQEQCGELKWYEVSAIALLLLGRPATAGEITATGPAQAKVVVRGRTKGVENSVWLNMATHTPVDCPNITVKQRFEPPLFWKEESPHWRLLEEADQIAPELFELADQIKNYQPQGTVVCRHEFVTFHQSYSYEDFIEGIKPVMDVAESDGEGGQVQYAIEPGIFMRMVRRAMADPSHSYALFIDEINRANISNVFGELLTLLEPDKRMTYNSATERWEGGVRLKLPYTHSASPREPLFGVPDNLFVIGTMNTADRSIALLDLALRRRFTFEEMMPNTELLATNPGPVVMEEGEPIHLDRLLAAINQRLEYLYDRDHTIGHSYLVGVRSLEDLEDAFLHKILPLLQEYFYGDWHKIQLVLGDLTDVPDVDARPKAHPQAIVSHVVQRPQRLFGVEDEVYQNRRSYVINEELSADSFRKIYQTLSTA